MLDEILGEALANRIREISPSFVIQTVFCEGFRHLSIRRSIRSKDGALLFVDVDVASIATL